MENNGIENLQSKKPSINTQAIPNTPQNLPNQSQTTVLKKSESPKKRSIFFKILVFIVPVIVLIFLSIAAYFVIDKIKTPAKIKEKVSVTQPLFMDLENSNEKIFEYLNTETTAEADSIERENKKEQTTIDNARNTEIEIKLNLQDTSLMQLEDYKKLLDDYMSETDKLLLFTEARINQQKAYKDPLEKHRNLSLLLESTGSLGITDQEGYVAVLNKVIAGELEVIQDLKKIKINNPNRQESHENFISQLENTVVYIINIRDIYQDYDATALVFAQTDYAQKKADLIKEANRIGDEIEAEGEEHKDKLVSLSQQINAEYTSLRQQYNF